MLSKKEIVFSAMAAFIFLILPQIAIGEDAALEAISKGGWTASLLMWLVGIQLCLRGLAEGLTRISKVTENKWDNKAASMIAQTAWFIGTFLGKFGYSVPKLVIEEAATKKEKDAK